MPSKMRVSLTAAVLKQRATGDEKAGNRHLYYFVFYTEWIGDNWQVLSRKNIYSGF